MTTPTPTPAHTTHGTSAETLHSVVAAKDKAKAGGLTAKDTAALRVAFEAAKARVIRTTLLEREAAASTATSTH